MRYRSAFLAFGIVIGVICAAPASAQISEGGMPPSFNKVSLSAPASVVLPPVDVEALLEQDAQDRKLGRPFRFGRGFDVSYTLDNSGTWENLPDGGRIWRLKIRCPGAHSVNLLYDTYRMPTGAELFVYDDNREMVLGAFTARNNKDDFKFATAPVIGDVTIVEYYEPAEALGMGKLAISRVVHGYKNVFFNRHKDTDGFGDAGYCNNNINCPEGDTWQDDKRAVAMILTSSGSRICTGALVNNVRQDATPYFLTANHCLGGSSSWIFMFNYESPTCDDIDGPTNYTLQGSVLRATSETSDFALLELSEQPPDSYNVYFAGWSNVDTPSQSSTAIHHPSGDIKKISFDYDPVTSTEYLETSGTTHWRVENWDDGTTEPGSSGSPLFDQNHRIVGQLHGGYASCYSITADWYGKFAASWDGDGTPSTRLKDWLDPDNTGATVLAGFDPDAGASIAHTPLPDTRDTLNDYEVVCLITSIEDLVSSELLLHYHIASVWYTEQLQPTGNINEYSSFIPAQSAGTTIEYFITAADIAGNADTTATYSFFVDYSPAITIAPGIFTQELSMGDSAIQNLIIENKGNGTLDYAIGVNQFLNSDFAYADLFTGSEVEPPRRFYSDKFYSVSGKKGETVSLTGTAPDKGAGGPDGYGYIWVDSDEPGGPAFNWIDISGAGTDITTGLADDNYIGPFPIGFDFPFYGNTYTEFYVGSNGIIGFNTAGLGVYTPVPIPDAAIPNNFLAWLWDDLNIFDGDNPGGKVYYLSDDDRLIIQFVEYPEYGADQGDVVTAEVILDTAGAVTIQYLDIAAGFDTESCTVGIENADGSDGLEVVHSAAYLHDSLAIRFFRPYQWLEVGSSGGSLLPGEADTIPCLFRSAELDTGLYDADIIVTSNDPDSADSPWIIGAQLTVVGRQYTCGDANGDEQVDVGDAIFIINYIFKQGPAPDPLCVAEVNGDDEINVADVVYLIAYVFNGSSPPVENCCP